jgi:hypothetical protein
MTGQPSHDFSRSSLRAAMPGMTLAVLSILFGFCLGIIFGLNEDLIKNRLSASASSVIATVYQGNSAKTQPVLAKSWDYMQRGHLHGGGIGTAAIAMIVVLLLTGTRPSVIRVLAIALGGGALAYAIFWVWAGFLAPGLGSTGAAKETLAWLAMPSSGALVMATAAVLYLSARAAVGGKG